MTTSTLPTVLNRALEPISECLTLSAAQRLLRVKLDKKTQARLDVLADKCTEGELTPEERAEYESSVFALEMLTLLHTEARVVLARLARP